ncbi:hypothetical protein EON63_16120 [archaeon]|nr:MAG: hypothetical protein EON63_16120 [archaeon]
MVLSAVPVPSPSPSDTDTTVQECREQNQHVSGSLAHRTHVIPIISHQVHLDRSERAVRRGWDMCVCAYYYYVVYLRQQKMHDDKTYIHQLLVVSHLHHYYRISYT